MKVQQNNYNNGITFLGVLAIVFITLKLLNLITWSWWWVLSPIWIPWALFSGIFVVIVILAIFNKKM